MSSNKYKINFMIRLENKTVHSLENKNQEKWFLLDASQINLGRLATISSLLLRDKLSASYTPSVNRGNFVIIINSAQVQISGNKNKQKIYWRHSGRPGGMKKQFFDEMLKKYPEKIIEKAIKGMLPKNSLGRAYFRRLKVYPDASHNFEGKDIEVINI